MLFFCSGSCKLSPLRTAIATFLEQAIQGERELSFLARSPQQPSICLPLRDQSTRSALRPWDPWAAWIRKWSSAKQPSAVCEVFNWVSSTATQHGDVTCQKKVKSGSEANVFIVVHRGLCLLRTKKMAVKEYFWQAGITTWRGKSEKSAYFFCSEFHFETWICRVDKVQPILTVVTFESSRSLHISAVLAYTFLWSVLCCNISPQKWWAFNAIVTTLIQVQAPLSP